jgi:calcineurin-like phosphoesterase family protein
MKTVWFTADTHFGHKRIPIYARRTFCLDDEERARLDGSSTLNRPNWSPSWASVARMDDHLFEQINLHVAADDILWHLGDFCWSKRSEAPAAARRYRERINCRNVFLVMGNHDSEEVASVFDKHCIGHEIKVGKANIVLSHYAHCFWNRSHYGSWMLYGHAHGSAEEWLDAHMPGRLSMDVGVDNVARLTGSYRPISSEEIGSIFSSRKGCQVDGHKPKPQALRGQDTGYNHFRCQTHENNASP